MRRFTAKEAKELRLQNLIEACLERYSKEEIVEAFNQVTDSAFTEDTVHDLIVKGYCIFKPIYSYQADKLKEYAEKYIFQYINEQDAAILF